MNKFINGLVALGAVVTVGAAGGTGVYAKTSEQTPEKVKTIIERNLNNFLQVSNDTTLDEVEMITRMGVEDSDIIITNTEFNLRKATYTDNGTLSASFDITKENTTPAAVNYNGIIENLRAEELREEVYEIIRESRITAQSTATDIEKTIEKRLKDKSLSVELSNLDLDIAEGENYYGELWFDVLISGKDGYSVEFDASALIYYLENDSELQSAYDISKTYLGNLKANNDINEATLLSELTRTVNNSNLEISIDDYELTPATTTKDGLCEFTIVLKSIEKNELKTINYSKNITMLGSSNSSSDSSDSNDSSNSSSSSSSSHHSSSSSSGLTTNSSDTTTEQTNVEKATKSIVNSVSTNAVVGDSKEVVTPEGIRITVSTVLADGEYQGTIVSSSTTSTSTTISVDISEGTVPAVYKYVPELNKYIKLTDGIVIGSNTITLPTEANAVYYATTIIMPTVETVTEGWSKVNDIWYMLDATGNLKTGWVADSSQWYYLKEDGSMAKGWVINGDSWYYLNDNGSMKTGWIKDDGNWYYLDNNGSMASNTTRDGYTLSANGAWIA